MKIRVLLLALFIFLNGCIPTSDSSEPATATPDIMPRLNPSPTPSNSALPKTCQITDLKIYINEIEGYCFAYPTRFALSDRPSDKPDIQGPAVDNSNEPIHATLTVEVEPAATDKTLQEQANAYLKDFSVIDPSQFTWKQVPIGGETGWIVEPVPVMLAYRIVFVQHNGYLYRLL